MFAVAATLFVTNIGIGVILSTVPHPFIMLLNVMAIVCTAMGVFLGAVNFRNAAASRALSFIPYSRVRLGLGVLLAQIVLAALAGAYVAVPHTLPTTTFPAVFIEVLALTNLWVLWSFLICGPNPWIRWGMVGLALLSLLVITAGTSVVEIPGVSGLTLLGFVAAVSVLLFATWYLRARSIGAPNLEDGSLLHPVAFSNGSARPQARTAINLHLLGQTSVFRASWPIHTLCGCLLVVTYLMMRKVNVLGHPEIAGNAVMTMALYLLGTWSAVLPGKISHRARPLWLSGFSRAEVFAQVERVSLRCLLMTAVPLLTVLLLVWYPQNSETGRYLLLLMVTTAFCNTYLAIMNVHGGSPLNYPLIGFSAVSLGVFARYTPTLLIPVLEIVALPILRHIALQRWRQIDWMICKPMRRGRIQPA
jgi:hypothetical protein